MRREREYTSILEELRNMVNDRNVQAMFDSVGLGLTGGEQTDVSVLALQSGEGVTGLISTDVRLILSILYSHSKRS